MPKENPGVILQAANYVTLWNLGKTNPTSVRVEGFQCLISQCAKTGVYLVKRGMLVHFRYTGRVSQTHGIEELPAMRRRITE